MQTIFNKEKIYVYTMLLASVVVSFAAVYHFTGDLWFNNISYLLSLFKVI